MTTIVAIAVDGTAFVRYGKPKEHRCGRGGKPDRTPENGNVAKRHQLVPVKVGEYTLLALGPEIPIGPLDQ